MLLVKHLKSNNDYCRENSRGYSFRDQQTAKIRGQVNTLLLWGNRDCFLDIIPLLDILRGEFPITLHVIINSIYEFMSPLIVIFANNTDKNQSNTKQYTNKYNFII